MTKTEKGFIVPDGYTADINIMQWDKKHKDFKVLLIQRGELNAEGENNIGAGKWALPGGFVEPNETALEAAKRELKEETNISADISLFREGGVFDSPNRDPRGRIVTNSFFILVNKNIEAKALDDAQDTKWVFLSDVLNGSVKLFLDHKEIVKKHAKRVKYDIFAQTFEREFYGDELFTSILGEKYNTKELYELSRWSGRRENITTFYRNL